MRVTVLRLKTSMFGFYLPGLPEYTYFTPTPLNYPSGASIEKMNHLSGDLGIMQIPAKEIHGKKFRTVWAEHRRSLDRLKPMPATP